MDNNGYINGTLLQVIYHLWDQIPEHEKEREVNKIKKILDLEWNKDEMIQKYMKKLQDARYQLTKLGADPETSKNNPKGNLCNGKTCQTRQNCQELAQTRCHIQKSMEKRKETFCSRNP